MTVPCPVHTLPLRSREHYQSSTLGTVWLIQAEGEADLATFHSCASQASMSQASQGIQNDLEADRARGIDNEWVGPMSPQEVRGSGGCWGWLRCNPCGSWPGPLSYLPLCPHQNSVSSHEKRGAPKKRKAPQPPACTPIPVRDGGSLG